jgi:hypothetical protein
MSVHFDASRNRYVVRWRDDGRNRSRRFTTVDEAEAFDDSIRGFRAGDEVAIQSPPRGDGVYRYQTAAGIRFRFVFRQSDGSLSSRRGFTSRHAAVTARRKLVESVARREVKPARETFGSFWTKLLAEKRPYMSAGSMQEFETHGRKRLLPTFGDMKLAHIDDDRVRAWLSEICRRGC